MKKKLTALLTASLVFLFTAPAHADSVLQIWNCKLNDGKTGAELMAVSSAWLKAAKTMDGGEDIEAFVDFPIAANTGDGAFSWVMVLADAKTWGIFNNEYDGSPAAKVDEEFGEIATCKSSSIWQSVAVE